MGLLSIIKSQLDTLYEHVFKHIKVKDIANFQKIIKEIAEVCKNAKSNNVCLGDCVHCEHLTNKIKEYSRTG